MKTQATENKFLLVAYNHETETYLYFYSMEEFIEFLNEQDEFFSFKLLQGATA